ncbi:16S rRNA (uracil(1498)-N(3))-methyltransferase [Iodidimonas sp. SYSU 1G8]|uniref:16S rRNA (uracil(1498)-N(3))-methyltransferase n=1 Tax=Iodidimonas sp. SYSU 1G8 TaxID=3133967 RepID=UPI0031FEABAC
MAYDPSKIRLFIDQPLTPGADIALTGDQVHYLRAVMRQREGDRLHAFNGRDGEWTIALTALGKKSGAARAEASVRMQSSVPDLWLVFAPIKGARLDFIVQKATELGAAALVPALTDRTIVRNINEDRLRANAVEAAEQCECLGVPEVQAARPLRNILGDWPEGRGLIFCDEGGDRPALETLQGLRGQGDSWAVLTGPEGGFTDAERDMIRRLPRAVPISLGPRIMRADTAAVAALSLFQATLGDWATPPRSGQV